MTGLRAFVVLTMPADQGDWRDDRNLKAMMAAWHRLYECLVRRFRERPKAMHFKEHAGRGGRLHMNVLWSWGFIDQHELSFLASERGFGPICWISRIGERCDLTQARPGAAAIRYSAKQGFRVVCYARKTGSQTAAGDDWRRRTRRWSSTRAASREMGPRERNPDWYWSSFEPATEQPVSERDFLLLPEQYLPTRAPIPRAQAPPRGMVQVELPFENAAARL